MRLHATCSISLPNNVPSSCAYVMLMSWVFSLAYASVCAYAYACAYALVKTSLNIRTNDGLFNVLICC